MERIAARSFCMPIRIRYFTVPSASPSSSATCRYDIPSKYAISIGTRCASGSSAERAADRGLHRVRLREVRRVVGDAYGLALGRGVAAPERLLGTHTLDRAAVGHREQERAQRAAARLEERGLLPEANEHVLHDLLRERLVRQDPEASPFTAAACAW